MAQGTKEQKNRKNPQQSRSKELVGAILDASTRVLVNLGYDRASTNRIAEKAGVSIGSLYQYFSGKQAIVSELLKNELETALLHARMQIAAIGEKPEERTLSGAVERLVQIGIEYYMGAFEKLAAIYGNSRKPGIEGAELIFKARSELQSAIQAILKKYPDQISPDRIEALSFVIVHSFFGTMQSVLQASAVDLPAMRAKIPAIQKELKQFILNGILNSAE